MRFSCSCSSQGTSSGLWIVVVIVVLLTLFMTSAMDGGKDGEEETEAGDRVISSPGSHGWLITFVTVDWNLPAADCLLNDGMCGSCLIYFLLMIFLGVVFYHLRCKR